MFDYDVSAQPILYHLPNKEGSTTPVIIAMTKRGQIFVLDRRDGKPVSRSKNVQWLLTPALGVAKPAEARAICHT